MCQVAPRTAGLRQPMDCLLRKCPPSKQVGNRNTWNPRAIREGTPVRLAPGAVRPMGGRSSPGSIGQIVEIEREGPRMTAVVRPVHYLETRGVCFLFLNHRMTVRKDDPGLYWQGRKWRLLKGYRSYIKEPMATETHEKLRIFTDNFRVFRGFPGFPGFRGCLSRSRLK